MQLYLELLDILDISVLLLLELLNLQCQLLMTLLPIRARLHNRLSIILYE